jgi:SAM-dependent methyltransferase
MTETQHEWNQRYASGETPWDSGRPSAELCRILRAHQIAPCRALELGCGTGTNAVYLAQQGFDVTGIDIAPLAIEQARTKAAAARATVRFILGDVLQDLDLGPSYPLVFDRGLYHSVRRHNLAGFLKLIDRITHPGSLYLTLTGNANDKTPEDQGPPRVSARELCTELEPAFELIELREFRFDAVGTEGESFRPLAWSVLMRKR